MFRRESVINRHCLPTVLFRPWKWINFFIIWFLSFLIYMNPGYFFILFFSKMRFLRLKNSFSGYIFNFFSQSLLKFRVMSHRLYHFHSLTFLFLKKYIQNNDETVNLFLKYFLIFLMALKWIYSMNKVNKCINLWKMQIEEI